MTGFLRGRSLDGPAVRRGARDGPQIVDIDKASSVSKSGHTVQEIRSIIQKVVGDTYRNLPYGIKAAGANTAGLS